GWAIGDLELLGEAENAREADGDDAYRLVAVAQARGFVTAKAVDPVLVPTSHLLAIGGDVSRAEKGLGGVDVEVPGDAGERDCRGDDVQLGADLGILLDEADHVFVVIDAERGGIAGAVVEVAFAEDREVADL